MRKYGDVTEVVSQVCIELICDVCGREAEKAKHGEYFSNPAQTGLFGLLRCGINVNGDVDASGVDICYYCAQSLIEQIRAGTLTLSKQGVGREGKEE